MKKYKEIEEDRVIKDWNEKKYSKADIYTFLMHFAYETKKISKYDIYHDQKLINKMSLKIRYIDSLIVPKKGR